MIKLILQGMVVGVANIIPGVSGGTMLVAMGLYDRLIHAVSHMRTELSKSLKLIVPILAGAGLAVILLSRLFEYLLTKQPIPTNFAFCGLIAGSVPFIWSRLKEADKEEGQRQNRGRLVSGLVSFAVFFAVVIIMALLEETADTGRQLQAGVGPALILFAVGIIAAATMVIPGVSGSMVLMLLGYYYPVLHLINRLIEGVTTLDMRLVFSCVILLVPFGIGVLLGIVLIAKLIEWLLKKHAFISYMGILGLICSSPVAILLRTDWTGLGPATGIAAVITLICGLMISRRFAD